MGYFTKPSVAAIKAIDNELERLHQILGTGNKDVNAVIYEAITKLQNTLDEIAKRHNGLEY